MKIKAFLEKKDIIISSMMAIVVKNKNNRLKYMKNGSPPDVIITEWSSWLGRPLFFAKHLPQVKKMIDEFDGSGILV